MNKNVRKTIEEHTAAVMKEVITLKNEKEELIKRQEQDMDDVFCEFITVIDAFERSEQIIKEKEYDQVDEACKSIKRLLNAKKKALAVLEKYSVRRISFEKNHIVDELCITIGTEPDPSRKNGDIISVEKAGYTRNSKVIRPAEVIIVKN